MKLDFFSLKDSAIFSSVFWGVYGFGMALGSLSANMQCYVPVLLKDWRGASSSGACCLLDVAWPSC